MNIHVEYLALFRKTDSFRDSVEGFTRLLEADSKLRVSAGEVHYDGTSVCKLSISTGEVDGKDLRHFHLRFTWPGAVDGPADDLKSFNAALRAVRRIISETGGEIETLRDDLSGYYANKAYPLIHDIENMMRRLIANFMLVTIGREWTKEALPKVVEEALRKNRRKEDPKEYLNALYGVDFIDLGSMLFSAYSNQTPQQVFDAIKAAQGAEDVSRLQQLVPASNWQRYFRGIVPCDDSYLESRWKTLYELRCKVAHNAPMQARDLEEIQRLVSEISPHLQGALDKLSNVQVPAAEQEVVAEGVAQAMNLTVGAFISDWRELEATLAKRLQPDSALSRRIPTGAELTRLRLLGEEQAKLYDESRRVRNQIVHAPGIDIPLHVVRAYGEIVSRLRDDIEDDGYVGELRKMSESERRESIRDRIDNDADAILDSDEFSSRMAETNAAGYTVDDVEVESVGFDPGTGECSAQFIYSASGEQLDDKMYCGEVIVGSGRVVISNDGNLTFDSLHAEIKDDDSEADE